MATRLAANDKYFADKKDVSCDEVEQGNQSQQKSSPPNTPHKLMSQDSGYKNTHPIGSRKVTENIITYHEPIFQTVANTIYETQKTLNMGKRKADDLDKGEPSSPDVKRKKIDSPKTDTGFKVKKKCSIENIIERIRNEKTQSRGGGNAASFQSEKNNTDDASIDASYDVSADSVITQNTKCQSGLGSNDRVGQEQMAENSVQNILKEADKSYKPSEINDVVLDLSIKSKNCEGNSSPEKVPNNSVKEEIKHSSSIQSTQKPKCSKVVKDIGKKISNSMSEITNPVDKEKVKLTKNKTDKPKKLTVLNKKDSMKKSENKLSKKKMDKMRDKMKENKILKSLNKTSKEKLGNKSAIDFKHVKKNSGKIDKTQTKKITGNPQKSCKTGADKKSNNLDNKKAKQTKTTSDSKHHKQKVPIAFRRVKREASLNAATFVNIFFEKTVSPKLENKRSKSESDIALTPRKQSGARHSLTDVFGKDAIDLSNQSNNIDVFKTPKKEAISPKKVQSSSPKLLKVSLKQMDNMELEKEDKKEASTPKKPRVCVSDKDFEEIVKSVLNRSAEFMKSQERKIDNAKQKNNSKKSSFVKLKDKIKLKPSENKNNEKKKDKSKTTTKESKTAISPSNIVSKSPEEIAERKKKANLARLKKAREILIAKEQQSAKDIVEVSDESSSSESDSESDLLVNESDHMESDGNTRIRAKKGELCRAARTHVRVEAKTVLESTSVSPQWCECCQSNYYPSQPQQGTKVWRIKQLVDQGTVNPPELIQSASHHFIAAHARCAVRPYSSPTHVSVLDSGPYVAPLMSHGHMGCTACGCRHTGVLHTAQCQSCAILPCQRYSGTYSVSYPHGHGAYPHCGTCSFHSPGQPLIHQPQIPLSTEPPILVRHTVPLHDTSHPVPLQLSHPDSGIPTCQVPLQITEPNIQQISHCCQLSQGEIILRTNSQSDHELIDVGRDDFVKKLAKKSKVTSKLFEDENISKVKKKSVTDGKKASSKVQTNKNLDKLKSVKKELLSKKKNIKVEQRKKPNELNQKLKQTEKNKTTKKETKDLNKKSKSSTKSVKKGIEVKEVVEDKKQYSAHGWTWEGEGITKKITNIFDGQLVDRKCYKAIRHEDGEIIHIKDCVLVCSGRKEKDIPYVAKVTNFWEDPTSNEMMMTLLWYYRPEHVEGGRRPENLDNEVFAAKHLDESLVACIDDRGYVLTYNEYCRYIGEVKRMKYNLPLRKKVVPDPEEPYPCNRIPPLDVDPENIFLCRHVYDFKLKRVLKNPS